MSEALAGLFFAVGSAIANGSFSVLSKIGPVTHAQVSWQNDKACHSRHFPSLPD